MIARGFKPVGWVAAVAGAALGCYMLSLNVAAERAELAKIERQIILAKQDIRALQTELGTRGRLQQLEHWNAEVLALAAPTAGQFLDDAVTLARFDVQDPTVEQRAEVRMAAAEAPKAASKPAVRMAAADFAAVASEKETPTLVRKAAMVVSDAKLLAQPLKAGAVPVSVKPRAASHSVPAQETPKKPKRIDESLVSAVRDAARTETGEGAGGQ